MLIEFLKSNYELVALGISLVIGLVVMCKTGNKKYFLEVLSMVERKVLNNDKKPVVSKGQSFSSLVPVYRLNKATNELELTDEFVDIDEVANSCKDVALNAVLERFMPSQAVDELTVERDLLADKLDILREASEMAEDLKHKYKLDDNLSYVDVFKALNEKRGIIDNRIKELNEKEVKNEEVQKVVNEEE